MDGPIELSDGRHWKPQAPAELRTSTRCPHRTRLGRGLHDDGRVTLVRTVMSFPGFSLAHREPGSAEAHTFETARAESAVASSTGLADGRGEASAQRPEVIPRGSRRARRRPSRKPRRRTHEHGNNASETHHHHAEAAHVDRHEQESFKTDIRDAATFSPQQPEHQHGRHQ